MDGGKDEPLCSDCFGDSLRTDSKCWPAACRLLLFLVDSVIMFLLSWGRYGFDRHYEAHFATHLADVKRQLNITAKNNNSYAVAA